MKLGTQKMGREMGIRNPENGEGVKPKIAKQIQAFRMEFSIVENLSELRGSISVFRSPQFNSCNKSHNLLIFFF